MTVNWLPMEMNGKSLNWNVILDSFLIHKLWVVPQLQMWMNVMGKLLQRHWKVSCCSFHPFANKYERRVNTCDILQILVAKSFSSAFATFNQDHSYPPFKLLLKPIWVHIGGSKTQIHILHRLHRLKRLRWKSTDWLFFHFFFENS